jgi:hypothetical protein
VLAEAAVLPTMGGARVGGGVGGESAAMGGLLAATVDFVREAAILCSSNWRTSRTKDFVRHQRKLPHCRERASHVLFPSSDMAVV